MGGRGLGNIHMPSVISGIRSRTNYLNICFSRNLIYIDFFFLIIIYKLFLHKVLQHEFLTILPCEFLIIIRRYFKRIK